jgi:2',3'-cyclic-nucleotide 2'-phosphodiesterase (5'-nucleotidase family)
MNRISSMGWAMLKRTILFSLISIIIVLPPALSAESVDLVLLHINDTHGNLTATPDSIKQGENIGSMPRLARVLRELQKENEGHVLTFHAGDLFSRGEPVTVCTGGGIHIDVLEKLNVDAFVPGNGDYYFGIENLIQQTQKMAEKIVTANIKLRSTHETFFQPHTVINIKGVRIGIVGLGYINPFHPSSRQLFFENPIAVGKEQAKALRNDVDLLIALTHIGHQ